MSKLFQTSIDPLSTTEDVSLNWQLMGKFAFHNRKRSYPNFHMKTTLIPALTYLKVSVSRLRCSTILDELSWGEIFGGEARKAEVSLWDWTCTRSRKWVLKLWLIQFSDYCVPNSAEDARRGKWWSMPSRKIESHSWEGTSILTMAQAEWR